MKITDIRRVNRTLDNMASIVDREMLIHGNYATETVHDKWLFESGAICNGRKYCAVGTMLVSHGVHAYSYDPSGEQKTEEPFWRAVSTRCYDDRVEVLEVIDPLLAQVSRALNDAVQEYVLDNPIRDADATYANDRRWNVRGYGGDMFEAFFENNDPGRDVLLEVIERARCILVPHTRCVALARRLGLI